MKFLNKEEENLLRECLEQSDVFPAILTEKLARTSKAESDIIRSYINYIKVLCAEGHFRSLAGAVIRCTVVESSKKYEYFFYKNIL